MPVVLRLHDTSGMTDVGQRGFSLIEAVVAMSLLAAGVSALAQVTIATARAGVSAQRATVAQHAARERLEQLRALAWTSDGDVVPISDWSSNLSVTPQAASGGVGLGVSPASALTTNTSGYCDFLDANGAWMAGGTNAPRGAAWIRRWSIGPVAGLTDTLALQVVVVPVLTPPAASAKVARAANGVWLVSMRTRKAR